MGVAVRTAGQLKGEPTLNRGLQSTFIPRVQGVGQRSCGSFADWMSHVYWMGEGRAIAFSLWGRRQDMLYCSINSYNMGEGRTIRVWFFHSCIPRPFLVLSALSSLVTTEKIGKVLLIKRIILIKAKQEDSIPTGCLGIGWQCSQGETVVGGNEAGMLSRALFPLITTMVSRMFSELWWLLGLKPLSSKF